MILPTLNKRVPRNFITSWCFAPGSLQLVWHRRHLIDRRHFVAFSGCHSAYVLNSCIFRVPQTERSSMKPHSLPLILVASKGTTDVGLVFAEINSFFPVKYFRRQRGKLIDAETRNSIKEGREKSRTNARRPASLSWNQSSACQWITITSRACKHARKSMNSERSSPEAASVEIVRDRMWEVGWSSGKSGSSFASRGLMQCVIVGMNGSAMMMTIKNGDKNQWCTSLLTRKFASLILARIALEAALCSLILWAFWPS